MLVLDVQKVLKVAIFGEFSLAPPLGIAGCSIAAFELTFKLVQSTVKQDQAKAHLKISQRIHRLPVLV